jgi:glycosyltransferase involved in cell wall biosynthesis
VIQRAFQRLLGRSADPDVSIAHTFRPSPYGGSNQFLVALRAELRRRGWKVGAEVIGPSTRACLLNSFAFDHERLRHMRHPQVKIIHRIDGPVDVYRGRDEGVDRHVHELNQELADATIFQSHYSYEANRALGFDFKDPIVIPNAVDPSIFHPPAKPSPIEGRKIRLVATSWSDNPNKGGATYKWLDENLDWDRYEFTFVGRTQYPLSRARVLPPLPSHGVASVLRDHDIYVTASRFESCSNALLEALASGLPAAFVDSGSNAEMVGAGGLPFVEDGELPAVLDSLVNEIEDWRSRIAISTLSEVADRYLAVMDMQMPSTQQQR